MTTRILTEEEAAALPAAPDTDQEALKARGRDEAQTGKSDTQASAGKGRHHNNRGYYLIKGEVCFRRLQHFCRKYGLRLAEGS